MNTTMSMMPVSAMSMMPVSDMDIELFETNYKKMGQAFDLKNGPTTGA